MDENLSSKLRGMKPSSAGRKQSTWLTVELGRIYDIIPSAFVAILKRRSRFPQGIPSVPVPCPPVPIPKARYTPPTQAGPLFYLPGASS